MKHPKGEEKMLKFFKGDSKIKEDIRKEFDKLNLHTCCFTGHRSQKLPWNLMKMI